MEKKATTLSLKPFSFRNRPHNIGAVEEIEEIERYSIALIVSHVSTKIMTIALEYISWREKYGAELFLRYAKPFFPSAAQIEAALRVPHLDASDSSGFTFAQARAHEREGFIAGFPRWWYLLLWLCRLCPPEVPLFRNELIMAQAVTLVACRATAYPTTQLPAPLEWSGHGVVGPRRLPPSSSSSGSAVDTTTSGSFARNALQRSYEGALGFLLLYYQWLTSPPSESLSSSTPPPESLIRTRWMALSAGGWRDNLATFLHRCTGEEITALRQTHLTETPPPPIERRGRHPPAVGTRTATPSSSSFAFTSTRFPCSVCELPHVVPLRLSLRAVLHAASHTELGEPAGPRGEYHTSNFSPTTFDTLSLFSTEGGVVVCCSLCHLMDYATGMYCQVCGGVLR